ncbi:MAG: amidase, partial [Solirubrobacterales bacterium]
MSPNQTEGAAALAGAIAREETSAEKVVERALTRAEQAADLGIFWALDTDLAIAAAREVDELIAAGRDAGPLAGVPVAIKDSIHVAGLPTSYGNGGEPPRAEADAEIVRRARQAGAVPIGKVAMDQLGWTTGGWTLAHPPCLNPIDRSRSAGGSSTGSAAAVAAGITPIAIGADAAGSVRLPAAYCGLVGIRPPIDALPTAGLKITIDGVDCPGPIAQTMDDALLALEALADGEPAAVAKAARRANLTEPQTPVKVAALEDLLSDAEAEVSAACRDALGAAGGLYPEEAVLDWEPRGLGKMLAGGLSRSWGAEIEASPGTYSELIRQSADFGRSVPAEEIEDIRDRLAREGEELAARFDGVDVVACPTAPTRVPLAAEEEVATSTRFTRLFSALDWP